MMLNALYRYAQRENLALPPGYIKKTIKAYLVFSEDGKFVGLELPTPQIAVPCPDIGSLANSKDKSNVIVEKKSIVVPAQPNVKSAFFYQAMREGGAVEPHMALCAAAMQDEHNLADIGAELTRAKIKDSDRVSFKVGDVSLLESARTKEWWSAYRGVLLAKDTDAPRVPCLITGELTEPMATVPKTTGLRSVGGHSSGDALICFDKSAFCSYGLEKSANAPVSEQAYASVKAALDALIARAPTLAGMKFVHWYDQPVPPKDDPVELMGMPAFAIEEPEEDDEPEDTAVNTQMEEQSALQQADRLIHSVSTGEHTPNFTNTYYILMLSGVNGRVMIRRYLHGSYEELQSNVERWQQELTLVNSFGTGVMKQFKLFPALIRLMKYQKSDQKIWERMDKELSGVTPAVLTAIMTGAPLPDTVAARALAYIRSKMLGQDDERSEVPVPDDMACQWLKVWLTRRKPRTEEEILMPYYSENHPSSAYHCGALMAVYGAIQRKAMPDVNAGVIQRYYAAASQTPALVLGQLSRLSNYHLAKIENQRWLHWYQDMLSQISVAMGTVIPVTLDLEGQSYFALGYRQMWAQIQAEQRSRNAEYKDKQQGNDGTHTEDDGEKEQ